MFESYPPFWLCACAPGLPCCQQVWWRGPCLYRAAARPAGRRRRQTCLGGRWRTQPCRHRPEFHVNQPIRQKGRDLTQSYDNSPYTHIKIKKQRATQKMPPNLRRKLLRMRADLGRSVRVTTTIPLVWLNRFTGSQHSH